MANFNYVSDALYKPMSMQEMLAPFLMYKEAYDKAEEEYDKLQDSADFEYLKEATSGEEKSRQIYDKYANDLRAQAEDLAQNGLNLSNRSAILSLKRRYKGEIGRLRRADEALKEEKKLRQSLSLQDPSRLYATNNLHLDDYLDGGNPNLYNVSGNDLYAKAAEAAKAISARNYTFSEGQALLGNYYKDLVQTNGLNQETLDAFYSKAESIPAMKRAMEDLLEATGVSDNLTGAELRRAKKYVLNGLMSGAVYQESHSPLRDPGVIDAAQREQLALQRQELALKAATLQGKSSKSSEGKNKYPLPTNTEYVPGNNRANSEVIESGNVPNSGTKVKVTKKDGKYVVSIGEGEDELILGKINAFGDISDVIGDKEEDYKNFAKYFDKGGHWWQLNHTYDPEYDQDNIKSMLRDILDITKKGGEYGYMNYDYYLEPDNQSYSNHGGGFYRKYLGSASDSVFNDNPREVKNNIDTSIH